MSVLQGRFHELYGEVRTLLDAPSARIRSDLRPVWESEPYRRIVALGPGALAHCIEEIATGGWILAQAALKLGVPLGALNLPSEFPSEQELASAIIAWWNSASLVTWVWTATNVQSTPLGPEVERAASDGVTTGLEHVGVLRREATVRSEAA